MPVCYIIEGPNGAGKTTFATTFLPRFVGPIDFVNPDLIAKGLSPFDARAVAARAGRLVLQRIDELSGQRKNFAFETTLSGKTYLHTLARLRSQGYRLRLIYLWVPTPQLALARIAVRVAEGGHDVPANEVRRRMSRSLTNLFTLYQPTVHAMWLLDNSGEGPVVASVYKGSRIRLFNRDAHRAIVEVHET